MKTEKKFKFEAYNSINNSTQKKLVQSFALEAPEMEEWVATEKVHGANFSFVTDGEQVMCAKRSGIIKEKESFYNWRKVLESHQEKVLKVYQALKDKHEEITTLIIYGELFGGLYVHKEVPAQRGVKFVQKQIQYCPDVRFYAFDVWTKELGFLDFDDANQLFEPAGFLYSEALCRGSFEEVSKFDVESFCTSLPKKFGLPEIPDNFAEGVVIKPVKNRVTKNDGRVIVKIKHSKFSELINTKTEIKEIDPESNEKFKRLSEAAAGYINENRLVSVLSKDSYTMRDKGKIGGLLMVDAMDDFLKEWEEGFEKLDIDEKRFFKKNLSTLARELVDQKLAGLLEK